MTYRKKSRMYIHKNQHSRRLRRRKLSVTCFFLSLSICLFTISLFGANKDNNPSENDNRFSNYWLMTENYAAQTFSSELHLTVEALMPGHQSFPLGKTPMNNPIKIPSCVCWTVEPATNIEDYDWERLAKELNHKDIPGLVVPQHTDASVLARMDAVKNLRLLKLEHTENASAGLRWAKKFNNLRALYLGHTSISNSHLALLRNFEELRLLSLRGTKANSKGLSYLTQLDSLQALYLSDTAVVGPGLVNIRKFKNLRRLFMNRCGLKDKDLKNLQSVENLHWLGIGGNKITDKGIEYLKDIKSLRELQLNNNKITDKGISHLAKLKNISLLDLSFTEITDKGLRKLAKLKNLTFLTIVGTDVSSEAISQLKENVKALQEVRY